jgi:trehalose synthase
VIDGTMMLTVTVLSSTRSGAGLFSCERGLAPADCSDCPSSTVCFAEWVRSDTSRDGERTPVGSAGPEPLSPDLGGGEPAERTYDEQFYPARPRGLRPSGRGRGRTGERRADGPASADNAAYVSWLESESMLGDARTLVVQFAGQGIMWQNRFAEPDAHAAIGTASVWFTAYPISLITGGQRSFLSSLGDPALWRAFRAIGIEAVHTGPVKRAGGLTGWQDTPSVDGHFDRISTQIDGAFGTEDEFRRMCEVAGRHGATIIDDIVPGHTGKGADFRLAEMKVGDYPGIYHMVEIPEHAWSMLPEVPEGKDSVNLDPETELLLERAGLIIGRLQRVIFYTPGVKETNWSATRPVLGVDGVTRRWVYLHYFKEGQPSINWLDPSFAGMRLVIGDALHAIADLGAGGLRLDANGFLGVEKRADGNPAWSEGHPLSEAANHMIASMVRKVGGFTFQELNLSMDDISLTSETGADLSYDFVNRPAYHHALATGDTEFVRLTLNLALGMGIQPVSLVHALQNHDELTYELVHFAARHADDLFEFRGETSSGHDLAQTIRDDLTRALTRVVAEGEAPYNHLFTQNGIACTTASAIAAALGIPRSALDPAGDPGEVDIQVERVRRAHLLLAMFNAWQPGVFALSGWDLCGSLTLEPYEVVGLTATGDTRWLNRGAHDLMDVDPQAAASRAGMPRARALYGPLPHQLRDFDSFALRLHRILEVRARHGIATARQVDVPPVSNKSMLVMVHELEDGNGQVTVLNFSEERISGSVQSKNLLPGSRVDDMVTGETLGVVDDLAAFPVTLAPFEGRSLLVVSAT